MEDRRTFMTLAAAAAFMPLELFAQTPAAGQPNAELARHLLTGPYDGHEAVLVDVRVRAGSRSTGMGHRHTGPVLGYVLEGRVRLAINNEAEDRKSVG